MNFLFSTHRISFFFFFFWNQYSLSSRRSHVSYNSSTNIYERDYERGFSTNRIRQFESGIREGCNLSEYFNQRLDINQPFWLVPVFTVGKRAADAAFVLIAQKLYTANVEFEPVRAVIFVPKFLFQRFSIR